MSERKINLKKVSGKPLSFREDVGQSKMERLFAILVRLGPLQFVSVLMQIFFGLLMVGVALFGTVQPLWIAGVVNVFGCILSMVGAYQFYDMLKSASSRGKLIDNAVRNSIDFRN